jgi:hypothetical protein
LCVEAVLTISPVCPRYRCHDREIEITVGHDDNRRIAAEIHCQFFNPADFAMASPVATYITQRRNQFVGNQIKGVIIGGDGCDYAGGFAREPPFAHLRTLGVEGNDLTCVVFRYFR